MSAKNNGGPAFPEKRRVRRAGYDTNEFEPVGGMTLRDYLAAKALSATISNESLVGNLTKGMTDNDADRAIAKHAYTLADAMLAAREAA